MREVLTYSRRGSRFTPRQQAAWTAYAERWWVPDEAVDEPGFSLPGLLRPRGAADRRDRLGHRRVDGRAGRGPARPRRGGVRGLAPGRRRHPRPGRRGGADQRADARASTRSGRSSTSSSRTAWPGSGPSSPTPGTRRGTTSAGSSRPRFAALAAQPAGAGRRVAAGDRLGRLRRADGRGARRRAAARGRRGRAVGRATGDQVRAQGHRGRTATSPTSPTCASERRRGRRTTDDQLGRQDHLLGLPVVVGQGGQHLGAATRPCSCTGWATVVRSK